ncbi:oligosaccharide flippase family protein [Tatumella sp. JGM118]|uniref:oligosaccharide flippase family protein n=1 Tax=Tatumella sp. JGM118 TaxID=2799796 RepID=UPI001BAE67A7|nr:oligosaccharide flippase family protein [Tatumella sp. JGM118]MBS0910034.1 oligosaccharide flippase family protein [Tatumella sp. JGM118]
MQFKILTKLSSNAHVLKNSFWMMSEKIVSIFGLIFVTSFVAKYIGPVNFGKLTYAASIFAIVRSVAMLGTDDVIFQRISKNIKLGEKIIHATKKTRELIFFVFSLLLISYVYISSDSLTFIFSLSSCLAVYFLTKDVYSIYFNAILKSKVNTICNVSGVLVSLFFRYVIAYFKLSPEYLCVPVVLVTLVPFLLRTFFYRKYRVLNIEQVKKNKVYVRKAMVLIGRKLVFYTLSVEIFTKISQIFLGYHSKYELGIYTVAATLGTSFHFVLNALISSFMTQVYKENDINQSRKIIARIISIIVVISLCSLLFFVIFGHFIINQLYGQKFIEANTVLIPMVFICLFSGLSTVSERYIMNFNGYSYLQRKTNVLMVFNVLLSFVMIRYFGLSGAVYSLLITEVLSTTLLNYFFRSGELLKVHLSVFNVRTYL